MLHPERVNWNTLTQINSNMKLLDTFCKAGGTSIGYERAGFIVTGVDIEPQPNFPAHMEFIQADALNVLDDLEFCRQFDVIHASPVCKGYSVANKIHGGTHAMDIPVVRKKLKRIGKPYVIENVPGAPLQNYVVLCGSMFGLKVIRHRLFECSPAIFFPPVLCNCKGGTNSHDAFSSFENGAKFITVGGHNFKADDGRKAMGIDWMTRDELAQAIPPAYTQYIGEQMKLNLIQSL